MAGDDPGGRKVSTAAAGLQGLAIATCCHHRCTWQVPPLQGCSQTWTGQSCYPPSISKHFSELCGRWSHASIGKHLKGRLYGAVLCKRCASTR